MVKDLLDGANISDAEIASWADEVRRKRRATAPWHYINIPQDATAFDRQRDGNDGANIIDAIEAQAKILADRAASRENRAEALKFVVHFVGDIHQPLHCSERNGDKGGNKRLVFVPGKREAVSLHFVWDNLVVRELVGKQNIGKVAEKLDKELRKTRYERSMAGKPEDWANESHGVAYMFAYLTVAADGPPPRLDQNYINAGVRQASEQLKRGGVRLAMVLNLAAK